MLRITVPSQRKVDGHVRYKIELRRDFELVNALCEKRFSEIHALKDEVKAALGESLYRKAFGESGHAFPSKWAPNTAEKLAGWLQNLVRLVEKQQRAYFKQTGTSKPVMEILRESAAKNFAPLFRGTIPLMGHSLASAMLGLVGAVVV